MLSPPHPPLARREGRGGAEPGAGAGTGAARRCQGRGAVAAGLGGDMDTADAEKERCPEVAGSGEIVHLRSRATCV